MPKQIKRILGIDPGLANTGYGIIEKQGNMVSLIGYGVITTSSGHTLPERLNTISQKLTEILIQHRPDAVAVEELFFYKNAKSAFKVGQAKGVVIATSSAQNIPVFEFTPLQVKSCVSGYGRADKSQIQKMVKTHLRMKTEPKPDHAADALATALCCAFAPHYEKTA